MKRTERIENTLSLVKQELSSEGVRLKDLQKHYPNSFFWKAVNKIGLIENEGTDKHPQWKWVGGKIVKGDVQFIYDFMRNKEIQRNL